MKTLFALLAATSLIFSGCAGLTDWTKSPGGQAVINQALIDALKIVGVLLSSTHGFSATDMRAQAIGKMEAAHPEMSRREAAKWVDIALEINDAQK